MDVFYQHENTESHQHKCLDRGLNLNKCFQTSLLFVNKKYNMEIETGKCKDSSYDEDTCQNIQLFGKIYGQQKDKTGFLCQNKSADAPC